MKRYILNFKRLLILFAIVPLFIGNSALSIISISSSVRSTVENLKDELKLAAMGLKEYYDYDLVNNNDLVDGFLEYDTDYLDKMAATGIDFTIFKGKQRFMTTIKDENGERIEGTFADDDVWAAVSKGEDYYSDQVVINGIKYHVYYMPLGPKDNICGMAFAGKPDHDIANLRQALIVRTILTSAKCH